MHWFRIMVVANSCANIVHPLNFVLVPKIQIKQKNYQPIKGLILMLVGSTVTAIIFIFNKKKLQRPKFLAVIFAFFAITTWLLKLFCVVFLLTWRSCTFYRRIRCRIYIFAREGLGKICCEILLHFMYTPGFVCVHRSADISYYACSHSS